MKVKKLPGSKVDTARSDLLPSARVKNKPGVRRALDSDPLHPLFVIRSLEVGPVRLEKDRLTAPYTLATEQGSATTELIYKYDEPVFDLEDPGSLNLAGMIAAQVVLNYGLFADRIIFNDSFDDLDRRFLAEMAENTAREIYVKKFLEPNPFLVGEAAKLPAIRLKKYLHAELVFPTKRKSESGVRGIGSEGWKTDRSKHAIMSSGGKDSLLTFGLLKEMNREVHPVFVNESGRHWFTALNAYRYFATSVPNTTRIWTNSDRVFSWILQHLPFIRKDFADVRSDEYPIRLWTVAVFLFGALPLLRKQGIGRLLIGDEFDTTDKTQYKGITHYNGLFDQSRYFDETLTRYFQRKGWGISQFSILRQLSEMLIEKVLAERYPMLLRHQMSCHATHKEGIGIRPCGRCEKCRRIVGMLVALEQSPSICGYTDGQVQDCLNALVEKGVHQETSGVQQLAHLLHARGSITSPKLGEVKSRPRPEILKLRFDRERSPVTSIPNDLRLPLYPILLEHAEGSVKRTGRIWINANPLTGDDLTKPYPFESRTSSESMGEVTSPARNFILSELTWPEAQERFQQVDVALLPVGSFEQHGPHLPLDTDAFDADYLAKRVAAACSDPKPLVLPVIPYGVSYAHEDFSGTISIGPDTLSRLVYEIGVNVARQGITKLVIINGHGGNAPALHFAAQMINRDTQIFTCVDTGETSDADIQAISPVPNDVHAGDIETSTSLAVRPELVRMDRAEKFVPKFSSTFLDFTSRRSIGWYARTAKISSSGVFGDPTLASRDKGETMWDIMIERLVELIESLKKMTLDEIYQKNF